MCFLWPTWVHNTNGKLISSAVFAQLTAESPYALQWGPLPPQISPFPWGSGLPSNSWFLGPDQAHNLSGITIVSALPLPMADVDPHLIHSSLAPPESSAQMASWLAQPFLQGSLVWQTDGLTDLATRLVTIGRIYVCSRDVQVTANIGSVTVWLCYRTEPSTIRNRLTFTLTANIYYFTYFIYLLRHLTAFYGDEWGCRVLETVRNLRCKDVQRICSRRKAIWRHIGYQNASYLYNCINSDVELSLFSTL